MQQREAMEGLGLDVDHTPVDTLFNSTGLGRALAIAESMEDMEELMPDEPSYEDPDPYW